MGRRYSGGASYVERIAHTLANDIVKYFTGKPGIFLSTIVYVSDLGGNNKEISAMDFDGRGVRQLTSHKSIAISPTGANGKFVYTSYVRLFPLLWTMDYDGGNKREVPTGVDLNASPSLSSDGALIAFAGSAKGNSDIYTVPVAGGTARRLTSSRALEASPAWSPTGRQILYTSDLTGTPQIYVMDSEGTGSRRVTFAGNWNDEGAWSPDGARIAFACRNEGDFNICVMDLESGRTVQLHLGRLERASDLVTGRREDRLSSATRRIHSDLHDGRDRPEQETAHARRQSLAARVGSLASRSGRSVSSWGFDKLFATLDFRRRDCGFCALRFTD